MSDDLGDRMKMLDPAKRSVVFAPPAAPLSCEELDRLYELPFTRRAHPSHQEPLPALEMIRFSLTAHRGCAGGCSFCALALHQGRRIASRSTRICASKRVHASHSMRCRRSLTRSHGGLPNTQSNPPVQPVEIFEVSETSKV